MLSTVLCWAALYLSHSGEVKTDANLLCMSWGTNIRSNEYRAIEHVRVSIPTLLDGFQVSDWEIMAPQLHMHPCFMCALLPIGIPKTSLPVFFFSCYRWSVTPGGPKAVPIRALATLDAIFGCYKTTSQVCGLIWLPQVNLILIWCSIDVGIQHTMSAS